MASGGDLSYGDYLKAAFSRRPRVPLLGRLPLNYLAIATFSVLGLANPGFWLLGAAAELSYLVGVAGSRRFRTLIQGERLLDAQTHQDAQVQTALDRLPPASAGRYRALLAQCREVLGISAALDPASAVSLTKVRTGNLNQLLAIFLRLLTSREVLVETMSRTDRGVVERELAALAAKLEAAAEDDSLTRALRGTYEIQRKRLENLDRAVSNLAVIDAELGRIDHQVALIREETAVSGRAEGLSDRLDAVSGALEETNRWMDHNSEIFGSVDGAIAPEGGLPVLSPPPVPARTSTERS